MLTTLEVLKAKQGDSLLLHCGTKTDPKIMVIDGGPSGVFNETLKPRLLAIKENLKKSSLPLSMVMVSHLDDDHINGIHALTDFMIQLKSGHQPIPFDIENLWCNNFDDIIGNIQLPTVAGVAAASVASAAKAALPKLSNKQSHIAAVIASVDQGRKLRNNAKQLGLVVNKPFKAKNGLAVMVRGDIGQKAISLGGAKITVIHPNTERLEKLQKEWDKKLKEAAKKGDGTVKVATIAKLLTGMDTSPYNLSSIVCLVEVGKRKILLTGDARMDDIEEGLKKNKLLKNGKLKVDIFKLPHHGSIRNATKDLLKIIQADHYVISADGANDNPDKPLLEMLADNISTGTIYLTYQTGKKDLGAKLKAFEKKLAKQKSKLKLVYRKEGEPSIVVDLEDKLSY